jgi:acetolactate decarboxylase
MSCKCGCHEDPTKPPATGWRKFTPLILGVAVVAAIVAGAVIKGNRAKPAADTHAVPHAPLAEAMITGASESGGVRWVGEMHKAVHEGDTGGKVALASLLATPHLFAIGPVAGLRGEITVIDGAPSIGLVGEEGPLVSARAEVDAAFLVWAREPRWVRLVIPESIRTEQDIETFVPQAAKEAGLTSDEPLPFRIEGRADRVDLHVIWQDKDTPPGKEAHEKAKVPAVILGASVAIVGFWSPSHRGVFTPAFSDIHMHVVSGDGRSTGHVESMRLAPGAVLMLPDRADTGVGHTGTP